jgi:four helix bundle protein
MARNYKNIVAWQRSHEFVLIVYQLTTKFPESERFGLTSQMRRAAVSVPANIAEGAVRNSHVDYLRFLTIAIGSLNEVDYFLLLTKDLGYLNSERYVELQEQIARAFAALHGLIKAVRNDKDGP